MKARLVLLIQLDGKLPSVALMRLAAHERARGARVVFSVLPGEGVFERRWWEDEEPDQVYVSLIFTWSRPLALKVLARYPGAVVGGTGWDLGKPPEERRTLEALGVGLAQDYSLYPGFKRSVGYTMRGCRMTRKVCSFCDVPLAEGRPRAEQDVSSLYRGEPFPRDLLILDNDFFGRPGWRELATSMREGRYRVCFNQGVNARLLTDEAAEALVSLECVCDRFRERRVYTAWDSKTDEARVFQGLEALVRYGEKPENVMVYMLVGYWPGETEADRLYRYERLKAFGCLPFPMPYRGVTGKPTKEVMGFARWVIRRYDAFVSWDEWKRARFQVRNVTSAKDQQKDLFTPAEVGAVAVAPS